MEQSKQKRIHTAFKFLTLLFFTLPLLAHANYYLDDTYTNTLRSRAANPASAGFGRMAVTDAFGWRNNANSGNLMFGIDGSDNLQFNATKVLLSGAVVNVDINASAAIAYSKLSLAGSILSTDLSAPVTVAKGGTGVSLSATGGTSQVLKQTSVGGNITVAQLACADLSNGVASCSTDTTNASNISSGTIGAARLPNPSASTLGGVESLAAISHNFLTSISTSGVPTQAQPAFSDISGTLGLTTQVTGLLPVANGGTGLGTLTTHSLQVGAGTSTVTQIGVGATGTVLIGTSSADPSFSAAPVLGASGTTGSLGLSGTTSGTITIKPQSAAGTYEFDLPNTVGAAGTVLTSQGGAGTAMTWSSVVTNPMTTGGDIIYGGASGVPTRLANGTAGFFLKAAGGTSAPTWSEASVISHATSGTTYNTENIERATLSGVCAINFQSGTWITGTTQPGTGRCQITIASGIFSGTPTCVCSGRVSAGGGECTSDSSATLSSTNWNFTTASNAGTNTNQVIDIICMGPK